MNVLTAKEPRSGSGGDQAPTTDCDAALALLPDNPIGAVALRAQQLTAAGRDADAARLTAALRYAHDPTDPNEIRRIIRAAPPQASSPPLERQVP